MTTTLKRLVLIVLRPILFSIMRLFFDRGYLRGRFFENSLGGFAWCARAIWVRNLLRLGRTYPWPVGLSCHISNPANIIFHPDDLNNFQSPGTYFQNVDAKIILGRGCYIGPNVGVITSNHDPAQLERHLPGKDVVFGENCWIGMNSVILPGVVLGPNTIVAAGSVVTRAFPLGNLVLGGAPARIIRENSNVMHERRPPVR